MTLSLFLSLLADELTKSFMTGTWKDQIICVRTLGPVLSREIRHKTKKVFLWMRDSIKHANVLGLFGLMEMDKNLVFVSEFCPKGELQDVLFNDKFNLDNNFKFSMSTDIAQGVLYLHNNGIVHGNINTNNCYIDARWNVKIADWEFWTVADCQQNDNLRYKPLTENEKADDADLKARQQFWRAPELIEEVGASSLSDTLSFVMRNSETHVTFECTRSRKDEEFLVTCLVCAFSQGTSETPENQV